MLDTARWQNAPRQPAVEKGESNLVLGIVLGNVGVAFAILAAAVGLALGDAFRGGHASWVPVVASRGPLLSALAALLMAPIGGAALLAGLSSSASAGPRAISRA